MNTDLLNAIGKATQGCSCLVTRLENGWSFSFTGTGAPGCAIFVSVPWRIVTGEGIAHAADDDGQWFGLPEPVDGEAKANALLSGRRVTSFTVDRVTADLRAEFDDGARLEVFNNSTGYEGWIATFQLGPDDVTWVGGGGGDLSFVSVPKGTHPKLVVGQPLPRSA
ncbi:MAG: hypothetical protein ACREEO_02355 [Phenylobacterium sp.]